jgi:hypothetical protein
MLAIKDDYPTRPSMASGAIGKKHCWVFEGFFDEAK